MTRTDNPGTGWKGVRVGPQPENEADHYFNCKRCGQAVDMRDLGQVLHHEQLEHEPLDLDS